MAPYGSEGLTPTQSPTFSAAETVNSSTPSTSPCMISHACSHFDEDDDGDASLDLKQPCHGWPKLVDVMVEHPGFESFQAFRDLNLKSLLYYQAELVQLREELHEIEWQDHRKGGEQKDFCSDIQTLLLTRKDGEAAQKQLKKIKRIREVLKEYNDALLQYAKITELPEAEPLNVRSLRQWIEAHWRTDLNISGPGSDSWGKLGHSSTAKKSLWRQFGGLLLSIFHEVKLDKGQPDLDLVVPGKGRDIDSLTRWVAGQWIPFWNNFSETPFCRVLCKPFGHKEVQEEKLPEPGGILDTRSNSNASTLSSFKRWLPFQRKPPPVENRKEDNLASLATYSMKGMIRFTNGVATIVACLFPIVGIVVLSRLHTNAKILGFIALFTAIFAIGIMILTDASTSRTEIFTATAAFAAVLVVFVQNQSPGSGG